MTKGKWRRLSSMVTWRECVDWIVRFPLERVTELQALLETRRGRRDAGRCWSGDILGLWWQRCIHAGQLELFELFLLLLLLQVMLMLWCGLMMRWRAIGGVQFVKLTAASRHQIAASMMTSACLQAQHHLDTMTPGGSTTSPKIRENRIVPCWCAVHLLIISSVNSLNGKLFQSFSFFEESNRNTRFVKFQRFLYEVYFSWSQRNMSLSIRR